MRLTDPHDLIDGIDREYWDGLRGAHGTTHCIHAAKGLAYVEPTASLNPNPSWNVKNERQIQKNGLTQQGSSNTPDQLSGKVQRLEDFIDTDAVSVKFHTIYSRARWLTLYAKLAPAAFLVGMPNNQAAGEHCLEFTHPEFRDRVKDGFNVVVAGNGFGCGSSREQAVMALLGRHHPMIPNKSRELIISD